MAERVRVVLSGATGRMGLTLARLIALDGRMELVGGIGRMDEDQACDIGCPIIHAAEDAGEVVRAADVVIDFSAPELLRRLLDTQREAMAGTALVVGTTGLSPNDHRLLADAAGRSPVLVSANFSVGVNLLLALAERAAAVLGPDYDVEIVEAHHRRKADAPSGTAIELGRAVARGRQVALDEVRVDGRSGRPGARPQGEIGFHSVRGGDIVGEHRVMLIGERERVELGHVAADRDLFAAGALRAAGWIVGRPAGTYGMADVLGLS
ncbi:MAG TPA: 4-hydroxy-tetrahydrodipicolinate reductase [Longimicrobiaceae bacterium]|jgi:4-hydroxy-tetrahydrodipicolinate reductase|nr:4-hydroxy-tetrahydrodipicolinate reductase [Longimicrobiaceae bacterium]